LRAYGQFRTQRLVLEAWDQQSQTTGCLTVLTHLKLNNFKIWRSTGHMRDGPLDPAVRDELLRQIQPDPEPADVAADREGARRQPGLEPWYCRCQGLGHPWASLADVLCRSTARRLKRSRQTRLVSSSAGAVARTAESKGACFRRAMTRDRVEVRTWLTSAIGREAQTDSRSSALQARRLQTMGRKRRRATWSVENLQAGAVLHLLRRGSSKCARRKRRECLVVGPALRWSQNSASIIYLGPVRRLGSA
jgi:hypothetical protein